jgi:hypothetical protein
MQLKIDVVSISPPLAVADMFVLPKDKNIHGISNLEKGLILKIGDQAHTRMQEMEVGQSQLICLEPGEYPFKEVMVYHYRRKVSSLKSYMDTCLEDAVGLSYISSVAITVLQEWGSETNDKPDAGRMFRSVVMQALTQFANRLRKDFRIVLVVENEDIVKALEGPIQEMLDHF